MSKKFEQIEKIFRAVERMIPVAETLCYFHDLKFDALADNSPNWAYELKGFIRGLYTGGYLSDTGVRVQYSDFLSIADLLQKGGFA